MENFSNPVNSLDSNGDKVFALLVGYCKLRKLEGYNAIPEGDSLSTIQCGSGKSSCPWRLAD